MKILLRDQSGTTLTEFVICLPMLIICFFGIIRLSGCVRDLNAVEAQGFQAAMEATLDAQESSLLAGSLGIDVHSRPTPAALDAMSQLDRFPPRQKGPAKHFLTVSEMSNYSFAGLALSGHMGESYARTRIPRLTGAKMAGVENAASPTLAPIIGTSMFATQLLNDAPGQLYDHNRQTAGQPSYMKRALAVLNSGLDQSGGRAAFAAGIRYGTRTGHFSQYVGARRAAFEQSAYYTITVAPYTSATGNDGIAHLDGSFLDSLRAISVVRVTMAQHAHYNEILGFTGLENSRDGDGGADVQQRVGFIEGSHLVDSTQVNSPNIDQTKLMWPLDYDSNLVGAE